METKIYVGNLPWAYANDDLTRLFEPHGEVKSAKVIIDAESGRSRGFGFVEMATAEQTAAAIAAIDGTEVNGRALRVSAARERQPRAPRPAGGTGGGGFGGGRGARDAADAGGGRDGGRRDGRSGARGGGRGRRDRDDD